MRFRAILGLLALQLSGYASHAQSPWKVVDTFHIGGEGGWDYLTVDAESRRLFVPRTTHTMVIDGNTGKTLADIPGQKTAHGVAIVPQVGRGFISDGGGSGRIIVFDLKTYAVLGTLAAEPDADGIIFDEASGLVLLVSGDKHSFMSFKPDIDPRSGKIDAPIDLGGSPEFLASDGAGRAYVNVMDKDLVAVIDLKARKVVARWPVKPGGSPVGMAIDRKNRVLVIGCRKPQRMVVMSLDGGHIISDLPIGTGVDATASNNGEAFASSGDGSLAVAAPTSAGAFAIKQVLKTGVGARTMGLDPTTEHIYLPTSDFEDQAPGATGRPKAKPGSFKIIVAARQ